MNVSIPLMALLSTTYLQDGSSPIIFKGGEKAQFAIEHCLNDGRDLAKSFIKVVTLGNSNDYVVRCDLVRYKKSLYYGMKGQFRTRAMLDQLIGEFGKYGHEIRQEKILLSD
jgi:hypothetical protein